MCLRKHCSWILFVALIVSWINGAVAEDSPVAKFDDPDAKGTGTGSENRVVLEAGDADAKATARLASAFPMGNERYGRYSFTLTAPFDSKKASKVDVGTLSGLTTGTNATLELGLLHGPSATDLEYKALTASCESFIPRLIPGYDWTKVSTLGPPNMNCDRGLLDKSKLIEVVKSINNWRATCKNCRQVPGEERPLCEVLSDARKQTCSTSPPDSTKSALCALVSSEQEERECSACANWNKTQDTTCDQVRGEAKLADNIEAVIKEIEEEITAGAIKIFRPLTAFTLSVKANAQDFSYVLADDPVTTKESSETGYGVSLAYSYVGRTYLWTAGYSHEESYKANDKTQICTPIGTTSSTSCSEGTIGAPKKQNAELAFLESRWIVSVEKFAVAPRLEYDLKKSEWAVRVPLYFILNPQQQFTGGLTLGYSEANDEGFGAAVFVSKAFKFFD